MSEVCTKCPAKINISLDVTGKREDGYHLLEMIMQSVELYDEVKVSKRESGIYFSTDSCKIPYGEDNICIKAAALIIEEYNIGSGVDIFLSKHIPVAAGLAGGSTDAAGVINVMDELFELNMSLEDKMRIGLKLGADVPFCLQRGTALAKGIGEELTSLEPIDLWCVIAKPDVDISTAEVYKELRLDEIPRHPETQRLCEYIKNKDYRNLSANMVNVLENVTIKKHPVIYEIKNIMMDFNAMGSIMSGSGPSVFGLFEDMHQGELCYNRLRDYIKEVYLVKTE